MDLRTFADVFTAPPRGLAAAADRRSVAAPLLAATAAALVFAGALVPRLDPGRAALEQLERSGKVAELTPAQLADALASARKMGAVMGWAGAALGPAAVALATALFLWVGLRVAGARPAFAPALSVAAWSGLPVALGRLLGVPGALRAEAVAPGDVARLLPWNLAHWIPETTRGPAAALAASVDLFGLWGLALLVVGAAQVAAVTRPRAAAVVLSLWAAGAALGMAAAAAVH
ncbi:MAG TPA: YIP1 family protein [Anaeromyxobacteraceae bacterium]|jgi:hypothetical protein